MQYHPPMLRLRTPLTFLVLALLSGCLGRCGGDGIEAPTPTPDATTAVAAPAVQQATPSLDDHWDFSDVAGTEGTFRQLLEESSKADLTEEPEADLLTLELQTQIARTRGLQDDFDGAGALLDQVDKAIADNRGRADRFARVRVRALLERGRVINSSDGPKEEARDQFVQAWELARSAGEDGLAVDAAHMVAIVDRGTDGEMEWSLKALELAESSPQPRARRWRGSIYNNLGWTFHDQGDFDQALEYFDKQIVARKEAGKEPALRIALWARARCLRSLKRNQDALGELDRLVKQYGDAATKDGFVHEEYGENLLALGEDQKATESFGQAVTLLTQTWVAKAEPERIERLKRLSTSTAPPTP